MSVWGRAERAVEADLLTRPRIIGPVRRPYVGGLPFRLRRHVEVLPSGCWAWRGRVTPAGYGRARRFAGASVPAHRLVTELLVGPAPAEFPLLDHVCHRPAECPGGPGCPHRRCVRPDHLLPVTVTENNAPARSARW